MTWLTIMIFSGAMLMLHNLGIKLVSQNFGAATGMLAYSIPAFLLLALFFGKPLFIEIKQIQPENLLPAAGAALLAAVSAIFFITSLMYAFQKGAPFGTGIVVLQVVFVSLTAIAGIFLFKESMNISQLIGVLLALGGIVLIVKG